MTKELIGNIQGFSPEILIDVDTEDTYQLKIKTKNSEFKTPNLKGGVLIGQSIGVSGIIKSKAFSASKWTLMELDPLDGDINTIDSMGRWVCPKNGIYIFSFYAGSVSISTPDNAVRFRISDGPTLGTLYLKELLSGGGTTKRPLLSGQYKFTKGDIAQFEVYSITAQTAAIDETDPSHFSIVLNSSINITVWDMYEVWKNQEPSRKDMSYDDWVESLLQNKTSIYVECLLRSSTIIPGQPTPLLKNRGVGDISDDRYVIPITGWWIFSYRFGSSSNMSTSATSHLQIRNETKNVTFSQLRIPGLGTSPNRVTTTGMTYCEKGDAIIAWTDVYEEISSYPSNWTNNPEIPVFMGCLIGSGLSTEDRTLLDSIDARLLLIESKIQELEQKKLEMSTLIESGSWTPMISGSTTAGGPNTYATQYGFYYVIGNLVMVFGQIRLSSKDSSMAGNVVIKGLPFISRIGSGRVYAGSILAVFITPPVNYTDFVGYVGANSAHMTPHMAGNNVSDIPVKVSNLGNQSGFYFTHIYERA